MATRKAKDTLAVGSRVYAAGEEFEVSDAEAKELDAAGLVDGGDAAAAPQPAEEPATGDAPKPDAKPAQDMTSTTAEAPADTAEDDAAPHKRSRSR